MNSKNIHQNYEIMTSLHIPYEFRNQQKHCSIFLDKEHLFQQYLPLISGYISNFLYMYALKQTVKLIII